MTEMLADSVIVVLGFYRGSWCPCCNMELRAAAGRRKSVPQAPNWSRSPSFRTRHWTPRPSRTFDVLVTAATRQRDLRLASSCLNSCARSIPRSARHPAFNGERQLHSAGAAAYVIEQRHHRVHFVNAD